jgi:hypothetical protein
LGSRRKDIGKRSEQILFPNRSPPGTELLVRVIQKARDCRPFV